MKRFKVQTRDVETGRTVRSRTIRAETGRDAAETAARRRYRLPKSAVIVTDVERAYSTGTDAGTLGVYLRSPSGALYPEPLYRSAFVAVAL